MPTQADIDAFIQSLWHEHRAQPNRAIRDYLIIYYMGGHVRRIAQRLRAQLPPQVEVDDLVNEAYESLCSLIDKFDITRDVRFESFSSSRLLGSMLDYLRALDPAPRLVRYRSKRVQEGIDSFTKMHGRAPSRDELRRHMKMFEKVFAKFYADARPAMMISLNAGVAGSSSGGGPDVPEEADAMAGLADARQAALINGAEREDLKRWITSGFAHRDKLIIVLYYYEHLTMKDIGRTLGCSESRVSQRLDSILACLKAKISRPTQRQQLAS